jgi:hypothetical protein
LLHSGQTSHRRMPALRCYSWKQAFQKLKNEPDLRMTRVELVEQCEVLTGCQVMRLQLQICNWKGSWIVGKRRGWMNWPQVGYKASTAKGYDPSELPM